MAKKRKIPKRGNALAKYMASFPQTNAGPHREVRKEANRLACRAEKDDWEEWFWETEVEDPERDEWASELEEHDHEEEE